MNAYLQNTANNVPDQFVYLSKHGQDEYINMLAQGVGGSITTTESFEYSQSTAPIVLRGMLKHKLMQQCRQNGRDFYYMDTGYLGNLPGPGNPNGWKLWHRIVKNNLQHSVIPPASSKRFDQLGISIPKKQLKGSDILIVAPSEKPCKFYGTTLTAWVEETVNTLKKYTDRKIIIRDKSKRRQDRVQHNSFVEAVNDDIHAVVVFNSNAATESILAGVPAFVTVDGHAAGPVANKSLSDIEQPFWPSSDLIYQWACGLAHGQVHVAEMQSGQAWKIIREFDQ